MRKFWHTARLSKTNRHKVIKSEKQSVFLAHTVVAVKQLKVVSAQYDDDSVIAPELVLVTPQFSMRVAKKWLGS